MKIIKGLISFILILTIGISVLGGCSEKTNDAYIYFELPRIPSTLDPQTASEDSELLIIRNIYEGLLRLDKDGNIVCGAAESYEKNGLKYTFKIREDAIWSNGEPVTADDFVFAFMRAVNPKTKAPYASRLKSIKNAGAIISGKKNYKTLGVKAENSKTLIINLDYEDKNFEKNLTTSVAMPCNEKLFSESAGKYGLLKDYIISNGSYRLTKWNKTSFGIRLYRHEEYTGSFYAKNAAIFITCREDEDVKEKLKENHIDMAFVDCAYAPELKEAGLKTIEYQNICWVMTLSRDFSYNMRNALRMLIGSEIYSANLPYGYTPASSIFPSVISENPPKNGIPLYNLNTGKKLYHSEIAKLENNKFPENIILYYYDNGNIKPVVTDIVGHWQSQLSAFVNIESASDSSLLLPELKKQSLSMSFFPIRADSENASEYVKKFGVSLGNKKLSSVQSDILSDSTVIPIAFQNTCIIYSPALDNLAAASGNGFIDFSFIIKHE